MRIYLDVSCLNRPFDDQTQPRIRFESEAVTLIHQAIDVGRWEHVSSRMAVVEIAAMPDAVRRNRVLHLLPATINDVTVDMLARAEVLTDRGLGAADAVHVSAAEGLQADVLLTCDDRLLRRCRAMGHELNVSVENPLDWLEDQNHAANA